MSSKWRTFYFWRNCFNVGIFDDFLAMFDATEEIDLTGTDDEDNDDGDVGVVWSCNSIGVYL